MNEVLLFPVEQKLVDLVTWFFETMSLRHRVVAEKKLFALVVVF